MIFPLIIFGQKVKNTDQILVREIFTKGHGREEFGNWHPRSGIWFTEIARSGVKEFATGMCKLKVRFFYLSFLYF